MPTPKPCQYQIQLSNGEIRDAFPEIFDRWTGRRYIDGEEYHAPLMSRGRPYPGKRTCPCAVCRGDQVAPNTALDWVVTPALTINNVPAGEA